MNEHVRVENQGAVLAITLTRPERRNAITVGMYAALADAFEGAAKDDSVRVITLRGEGQDFAAGNDLADFLQAPMRSDGEIPVWRLLRALATCETPIVAAVHGNCVGIGTTMLLHCDLVIADDSARFSLPFVDLALVPEAASSLLLPRLAGRRRAARYLLLCEPASEAAALADLFIRQIDLGESPRGEVDGLRPEVRQLVGVQLLGEGPVGALDLEVARLLAKPPEALRQTQKRLRQGAREEIMERMELESSLFTERLASAEVKEAITAFFAKKQVGRQ